MNFNKITPLVIVTMALVIQGCNLPAQQYQFDEKPPEREYFEEPWQGEPEDPDAPMFEGSHPEEPPREEPPHEEPSHEAPPHKESHPPEPEPQPQPQPKNPGGDTGNNSGKNSGNNPGNSSGNNGGFSLIPAKVANWDLAVTKLYPAPDGKIMIRIKNVGNMQVQHSTGIDCQAMYTTQSDNQIWILPESKSVNVNLAPDKYQDFETGYGRSPDMKSLLVTCKITPPAGDTNSSNNGLDSVKVK
ncbi:MAG: hypothetical protein JXA13_15840 [Anaerolineales bacterium]|nr:hypothetical protein [Anaerolineales bacterium]